MYVNKYNWIIWFYFLSEVLFFSIAAGNFRYYFFLSILLCIFALRNLRVFAKSYTFSWQVFLVLIMVLSSLLSVNVKGAIASSISCILYMLTGIAMASLVVRGKYSIYSYAELVKKVVTCIVLFGLFQYVVFKVTHIALTYQGASQLAAGQIPGVSVEANGHGKLVALALVISIPPLIRSTDEKEKHRSKYLLVAAAITMVLSMTRLALYGFVAAFMAMALYYAPNRKTRRRITILIVAILVMIGIAFVLITTNTIQIGYYSMAKLQKLFSLDYESISTDGSGGTRLKIIEGSIRAWLQSVSSFLIGHGQGQAFITDSSGNIFKVAATGIIAMLPSAGIIGEVAYIGMLVSPIFAAYKAVKALKSSGKNNHLLVLAEQTMFIGIFVIAMDFFSSTFVYPIMWVYIALGYCWEWYNQGFFEEA